MKPLAVSQLHWLAAPTVPNRARSHVGGGGDGGGGVGGIGDGGGGVGGGGVGGGGVGGGGEGGGEIWTQHRPAWPLLAQGCSLAPEPASVGRGKMQHPPSSTLSVAAVLPAAGCTHMKPLAVSQLHWLAAPTVPNKARSHVGGGGDRGDGGGG